LARGAGLRAALPAGRQVRKRGWEEKKNDEA